MMPMALGIDPGIRGCGAAMFYEKRVFRAAYVHNSIVKGGGPVAWRAMAYEVKRWWQTQCQSSYLPDELLLEIPRIYPRSDQRKGDLNDLLDLAGVQGAIAALMGVSGSITSYFPRDWKGTIPKKVCTERIRKALTDSERNCISWSRMTLDHNTLDAVGIGLYRYGRLHRKAGNEPGKEDAEEAGKVA